MDAHRQKALVATGKPELIILATEELDAETPAHLLDDDITPLHRLFVRNTGTTPALGPDAASTWSFAIDGCVRTPRRWTIAELQRRFATVTEASVLECAGNGRAFFPEPAGTVLRQYGAAGCVAWRVTRAPRNDRRPHARRRSPCRRSAGCRAPPA